MKFSIYKTISLILLLLFFVAQEQYATEENNHTRKVRNIILFIGDGMGVAQLYAGMTVSKQAFSLEYFPFSGLCMTYSADNYITDSAAGGTAIACGVKTRNGMIGVGPDSIAIKSIMEYAHNEGIATGIVSTSAITHATPASFVAHNSGRGNYEDIAKAFLNGSLDLFIGGGENHFRFRKDSMDLTLKLKEQGFKVVYTLDDLKGTNSKKIAGLLAKEHMPQADSGRAGALEVMTGKAIETLSKNENGFVLMVEGSMIDWGAHAQNIDYVTSEMIDLDKAIGIGLEFAAKNNNTLVVATADHETGGLTLNGGCISEHKITAKFSGSDHTAAMVPIYSFGPEATRFSGIHENTFFLNEFLKLLDIEK